MKEKPPKNAALLYDEHLGYWELWHKSRPVVHSVEKSRVEAWAAENGYVIARPEAECQWCARAGRKCWLHGGVAKVGMPREDESW